MEEYKITISKNGYVGLEFKDWLMADEDVETFKQNVANTLLEEIDSVIKWETPKFSD